MNATKADRTVALAEFGPTSSRIASLAESQQWCKQLTQSHGENFSVLSRFVTASLVNDFSAVYAFCRAADDLGDETESRERSTELLAWWRDQLHQCFAGHASHPIFVALMPVIARHSLPQEPFDDLISAFEMDQTKTRYETWDEVIGYCKLSADPVGRLVLMLLGERRDEECLRASDAICTALQLTNHWQDARRDLLERDRIYVPRDFWKVDRFEERLVSTCRQGYAPDQMFLQSWRESVRELTLRTWELFESGSSLLPMLQPQHRPLIWLFLEGGTGTLRQIETWNYETCLSRPRLSKFAKISLLLRARWATRNIGAVVK